MSSTDAKCMSTSSRSWRAVLVVLCQCLVVSGRWLDWPLSPCFFDVVVIVGRTGYLGLPLVADEGMESEIGPAIGR